MSELVSIIIPCYNYARYLPQAIDSALAQTHQPIEIIVVDDGSEDDTSEVAANYKQIHYYRQDNSGPAAARNAGFEHSSGSYIVFLDADDYLDHTYVETTLNAYQNGDDRLGFVYTQMSFFGNEQRITDFKDFSAFGLSLGNYIHASSLIKREVLERFRFDTTMHRGLEDWEFFVAAVEGGYTGKLVDKPLLHYRKHGDSGSISDRIAAAKSQSQLARYIRRKHWRFYLRMFPRYVIYRYRKLRKDTDVKPTPQN